MDHGNEMSNATFHTWPSRSVLGRCGFSLAYFWSLVCVCGSGHTVSHRKLALRQHKNSQPQEHSAPLIQGSSLKKQNHPG